MKLSEFFQRAKRNSFDGQMGGVTPRFAAILFFIILATAGKFLRNYEFSLPTILLLLTISAVTNLSIFIWMGWGKGIRYVPYFAVSLDVSLITIGVHYLGGVEAPISWIYAVCIMTVALVHGFRMSMYSALLCFLMYSSLLFAESAGLIKRVSFGLLNPAYYFENKVYLYVKLICDNCLFFVTALISGFISEQLIRSKKTLERQNKQLGLEIAERMRVGEELRKHREELEKLVSDRTSALTETIDRLQQEIGERGRVEERLRDSEEKYRLHFENAGDVILSIDRDFRVTSISPSIEAFLGYRPEEIVGQSFAELNILAPEYFSKAAADIVRVLAGARIPSTEYEVIAKDGKRKLAAVSGNPLLKNGEAVAIVSVARDITQHKELERQLFQAQKMESIGTLAGGIAHDFNNLLAGILGYASLTKTKIPRENQIFNFVETIEKSATRAAELTSQLLAFARGGKYEGKPIDLNSIIEETLKIIERTFDKSIQIESHLLDSIPTIEADAGQMQQVLMNLCVNARDAMPHGGKLILETNVVSLTEDYAKAHAGSKPGSYVSLSVTDTGLGMDKATVERIFEPFFTTKEKGKGTGLGLAMVYGVVKNHGGYVCVYSEPGEGSTFKVYLPVSGKPELNALLGDETLRGGNELILVVDDEESVRSLARDMLESYGYRVLLAEDGEKSIEILKENNGFVDLVILDMVMPKMGGQETFLKLKELNPGIRVLLSTGYSQNGKAKEILDSGVMGFLQKPYHVDGLLSKVRAVLDERMEHVIKQQSTQ